MASIVYRSSGVILFDRPITSEMINDLKNEVMPSFDSLSLFLETETDLPEGISAVSYESLVENNGLYWLEDDDVDGIKAKFEKYGAKLFYLGTFVEHMSSGDCYYHEPFTFYANDAEEFNENDKKVIRNYFKGERPDIVSSLVWEMQFDEELIFNYFAILDEPVTKDVMVSAIQLIETTVDEYLNNNEYTSHAVKIKAEPKESFQDVLDVSISFFLNSEDFSGYVYSLEDAIMGIDDSVNNLETLVTGWIPYDEYTKENIEEQLINSRKS